MSNTSEGYKGRKLELTLNILNILALAVLIPWGTWVTNQAYASLHFRNSHDPITSSDASLLKAELKQYHAEDVARVSTDINRKLQDLHDGQVEIKVIMKQLQERVKL